MKNYYFIISFTGTIIFHFGLFVFLNYSITPDTKPVETQEVKKSELNITPYDVDKTEPKELDITGEEVASNKPSANKAAQTEVRESKAVPKEPTANKLQSKQTSSISQKVKNKTIENPILKNSEPASKKINVKTAKTIIMKPSKAKVKKSANIQIASEKIIQQANINTEPQSEIKLEPSTALKVETKPEVTLQVKPNKKVAFAENLESQKILSTAPKENLAMEQMQTNAPNAEPLKPETQDIQIGSLKSDNVGETSIAEINQAAVNVDLPATFAVAGLAWSGEEDNKSVDPISLNAIQAFVQVGDLKDSGSNVGEVRDGITQTLGAIPCSRVQAQFIPETGSLRLNGHIPEEGLRAPILKVMQEQMGEDIQVVDNLLILPRPQCGIISAIKAVGLAQSTDQLTNPLLIGEDAHVKDYSYREGQRLKLDMIAPHYDSFIYVDYFDATGMVVHLQPNEIISDEIQIANTQLSVGREIAGKPSLKIIIGPPFGQEIAVAFASSEKLYDEVRDTVEPAAPYLKFLKSRISNARKSNINFKGEWVYFFISTSK